MDDSFKEFKLRVINRQLPYLPTTVPLSDLKRGNTFFQKINKLLTFEERRCFRENSDLLHYYNSPGEWRRQDIENDERFVQFMVNKFRELARQRKKNDD